MLGISDAAESIGFRTRGYRLTWEQLRDELPLPCIVHWNQRHFIVVYDIKKKHWVWGAEHQPMPRLQLAKQGTRVLRSFSGGGGHRAKNR